MPYETLVATIPGTDPAAGDIVFSCHLDHEKPGANDNASGCAANLEIARTLKTLIDAKRIPPPVRTIRFIWPSEMTGTIAYLAKYPEIASRIRAAVHLDMVGGDPFITKSVLHVTRSPWSIATVTDDVEEVFGRYVIDGAMRAAGDGDMTHAIRSRGGSKDAFWADITPYESGSDHWIYQEGGFAIPVDLPARSSGRLHPHDRRSARQHRADQDQAVGVHRRRERLLPGDDAGPRRVAAAPQLRQRARSGWPRTAARAVGDGRGPARSARRRQHRRAGRAARAAAAAVAVAVRATLDADAAHDRLGAGLARRGERDAGRRSCRGRCRRCRAPVPRARRPTRGCRCATRP